MFECEDGRCTSELRHGGPARPYKTIRRAARRLSIYGKVFVQRATLGLASFHFRSDISESSEAAVDLWEGLRAASHPWLGLVPLPQRRLGPRFIRELCVQDLGPRRRRTASATEALR